MNKLIYLLLSFVTAMTMGCNSPEKKTNDDVDQARAGKPAGTDSTKQTAVTLDLPAGATTEKLADTPGVIKVSGSISGNLKNGMREGTWVTYHPNGLISTMTSYVDGKREGLHVELNANGGLIKRCFYHNDMRHGEYKEFNYTMLKEQRTYQYDKLEGLVKIFYDNGKVMEEGNYKNGTRDGLSKWYDQAGNLSISYEYKNGELVRK